MTTSRHFCHQRHRYIPSVYLYSQYRQAGSYLRALSLPFNTPTLFPLLSCFRYLYFEYNEIREVDPGTFDSMPSLQLLFLNANLLHSLPLGVFSKVNLARLNLRNNHLLQLPMTGVLEHLTGLVQVGANLFTGLA